jgi:serine/threonine protein kinase
MEGTLYDLNASSTNYLPHRRPYLADSVLRQMLSALAYLGGLGYVHRDIKPDNIFYNTTTTGGHGHGGTHHFRLGDFGLCEFGSVIAAGGGEIIGTKSYLAPELHRHHPKYRCQTHKSDVWALYVTVLWALEGDALWDEVGYGGCDGKSLEFRYRLSAKAMRDEDLWGLRYMARSDPSERVTAKVMERVLAAGGPGVLS